MKMAAPIAVLLAAASVSPAQAQNCQMLAGACARGTRVTMNFQLSGPPPATGATSELTKAMAGLSQSLYVTGADSRASASGEGWSDEVGQRRD